MKPFTICTQLFFVLVAGLLAVPAVQAQEAAHQHHDAPVETVPGPMSDGEVVKVDREGGKITLRHGPLVNLNMQGMTMAFRVAEPAMLDQVKPGDKVQFVADKAGGGLTITALQSAN
ncbi:copper-binding protein [Massilia sp. S19_KUP03_FR1]|uniref:copper-binding protein n=1 Tax=Massilia sp. S19_KUP03_FR1 TaxID=3025503 RepID=UPI002FCD9E65